MKYNNEIWKDIKGHKGLYQVSSLGKVRNITKEKELKQFINKQTGYNYVSLFKNGNRKTFTLHRLVAQAFIPNIENKPQVNHIDGNKQNNTVENLEWCTNQENLKHARIKGLLNERDFICSIKNGRKIKQYDLNMNLIKEWDNAKIAGRELGIDNSAIIKCCRGIRHKCSNYIWKYAEEVV